MLREKRANFMYNAVYCESCSQFCAIYGMPLAVFFFVLKWLILRCRSVMMAYKALDEISGKYEVNETAYTVMAIAELCGKQSTAYRNRRVRFIWLSAESVVGL